ncbi:MULTISPECIES: carboxypeptidase regulatory-like domain-containing protein [unclassified Streptomyces]|uniref:carboxypeptidase regulatory-like domain-containing protein n=1 Tax=unclassified Streptomyces TaxID=2593676 RepID=UPI0016554B4F|nr:carboxypeptidase regulatory-like domain-containing protein [Streptomyces sp. CB02980]MCB8904932.1 carboxypeptidase regulatory-like domain-containing protein [Streptomyces sp. CB02980]
MFGYVRAIDDKKPIFMIKVSVYRGDLSLIDRSYTNEEGRYEVEIPEGETVTVGFDTHYSLTNADDWQPSAIANVIADDETPLDRYLMRRGQVFDEASAMDALNGYLLTAATTQAQADAAYAATAANRLSMLKQHTLVLQSLQQRLLEHFEKQT